MAQFDVHPLRSRQSLVIDCQSDLHRDLPTRFVVPLVPLTDPSASHASLAPRFVIDGKEWVMATHFAATLPLRDLGPAIASLSGESHRVIGAIDALVTGI